MKGFVVWRICSPRRPVVLPYSSGICRYSAPLRNRCIYVCCKLRTAAVAALWGGVAQFGLASIMCG